MFLGQAGGTYARKTGTGLERVTQPITRVEDIDGDGCLDIGTDITGYRDNQNWYIQNKVGATCSVTFNQVGTYHYRSWPRETWLHTGPSVP